MRFDDPERPSVRNLGEETPLHTSGSPLPVVTLVRPLQTEKHAGYTCLGTKGCLDKSDQLYRREDCPACRQETEACWGWLACIHAHRSGNRYGYHTGIITDLARFHEEYMSDPEACLLKYFRYAGPETDARSAKVTLPSLWEEETASDGK